MAEIAVDDDGSGRDAFAAGLDPDRLAVLVQDPVDRGVEADLDAHAAREPRHRVRHRAAAADRVKDAVLVFEEGQDREQARALERRHAEILRLEREGEPHARVGEVAPQILVDAREGPERRQRRQHGGRHEVERARERLLEHRPEAFELVAVVVEEAADLRGIAPARAARPRARAGRGPASPGSRRRPRRRGDIAGRGASARHGPPGARRRTRRCPRGRAGRGRRSARCRRCSRPARGSCGSARRPPPRVRTP